MNHPGSLRPRGHLAGEHADCVAATVGNVAVVHWRRVPQSTEARVVVESAFRAASERGPGGRFGVLIVLSPAMPMGMPSGVVRADLARLRREWAPHIVGEALLFEQESWRTALTRMVVRQLDALSKTPFPNEVFDSQTAALTWLCRKLPEPAPVTAEELLEQVRGLGLLGTR